MNAARKKKHDQEHEMNGADVLEDIVLEDTEGAEHSFQGKLKKLREELTAVKQQRDEHLAGWQRAKADLVNYRRIVAEDKERDKARARASLAEALIPALDSFESAMRDASWSTVDEQWRKGVEGIRAQLETALTREGLARYGSAGDVFDPTLHECMSVTKTDNPKEDHTIVEVLQPGYRLDGEVIRAAKVVVAQADDTAA